MNCSACGAPLRDGLKFCEECGAPVPEAVPVTDDAATQPAGIVPLPGASSDPADGYQPGQQQAYQDPYQQQYQYQDPYQQQAYQQYQQPYQPYAYVGPTDTQRALAMLIYLSGVIGLIVALLVRDRNDPFITHHLNNVTVITIGSIICSLLMIIIIGFFGLLFLLVVWVMGIVHAYNGEIKDLPLISKMKIIK